MKAGVFAKRPDYEIDLQIFGLLLHKKNIHAGRDKDDVNKTCSKYTRCITRTSKK